MSRSVMIPGPCPSGSITTAAPTLRSDISRAVVAQCVARPHSEDHRAHSFSIPALPHSFPAPRNGKPTTRHLQLLPQCSAADARGQAPRKILWRSSGEGNRIAAGWSRSPRKTALLRASESPPMSRQRSLTVAIVAAVIATAIGLVLGYTIHWFPAQASTQAHNTDRLYHVLVDRLDPDLRARRDGHPVLRLAVPHEARRGAQGRPADPRQHAPGGDLDDDPRADPARPRVLLVRRAQRQRKEARRRAGNPDRRDRTAVPLVLPVPAVGDRRQSPRAPTSCTSRWATPCTSTCAPRT